MSTQTEALQLADCIDPPQIFVSPKMRAAAAAELRRLHQVNSDLLDALKLCEGNIDSLLASAHPKVFGIWLDVVRVAIAKATGNKT